MEPTSILIIGGVIAGILLIIGLVISARDERSLVDERLEYLEDVRGTGDEKGTPVADWLNQQAGRYTWGQRLSRSLARADMKFKVGEFVVMVTGLTLLGAMLGWYLGGGANSSEDATIGMRLMSLPAICCMVDGPGCEVLRRADAEKLRQVFLNLAINAADAIAADEKNHDGQLTIQTEVLSSSDRGAFQQQETLKIIFEDNGPGISAEHMGNIFDPFFTTKEPGKGTGLGLSVSFMIIEGMGGTIKAASQTGRGTTLSVYLSLYTGADVDGGTVDAKAKKNTATP